MNGDTIMPLLHSVKMVVVAVVVAPVLALSAEYEFNLHHFLGANTPSHMETLVPWARAVEKNSSGRVKITIYPSMALGGRPPELVGQVRDGVVDMIWTVNGYTPGLFPRTEVFELPGVHTNNPSATNLAMAELFASDLKQEYKGVEVMFLHVHKGNGLHMRTDAVRTPADVQGKRLRIPTRTGAWVIEALGGIPVAMPLPSLPQALQKGVVDGAFIPWESIPSLKIQQQTQYQIEMHNGNRFGNITFQLSMNKKRWQGLPADIQQAFRDASGAEWLQKLGQIWVASDDFGIDMAVKAGNRHIVLTPAETQAFEDKMQQVQYRWVADVTRKGLDGAGLLRKAKAAVQKNHQR